MTEEPAPMAQEQIDAPD